MHKVRKWSFSVSGGNRRNLEMLFVTGPAFIINDEDVNLMTEVAINSIEVTNKY